MHTYKLIALFAAVLAVGVSAAPEDTPLSYPANLVTRDVPNLAARSSVIMPRSPPNGVRWGARGGGVRPVGQKSPSPRVRRPRRGPGRGPGRGPKSGPGHGPKRGPKSGPGRGPKRGPGRAPGRGPGRGPKPGPGRGQKNLQGGGPMGPAQGLPGQVLPPPPPPPPADPVPAAEPGAEPPAPAAEAEAPGDATPAV